MALLDRLTSGISRAAALRRAIRLMDKGNVKAAFPLLSRAARAGLAEAEYRMGRVYLEGAGAPPSRPQAVRWLERAAGHGFVEAQALLATLCLHGMAPNLAGDAGPSVGLFASNAAAEPDFPGALKWARLAAEGGSAEGQAILGYILTSGPETLRDIPEADRWYERSAAALCPQGQLGYALVLARDAKDPEIQAKLVDNLRQAAEKGLATALYLLGMVTERGLGGLPADRPAACTVT